jgi:hypothetical protein
MDAFWRNELSLPIETVGPDSGRGTGDAGASRDPQPCSWLHSCDLASAGITSKLFPEDCTRIAAQTLTRSNPKSTLSAGNEFISALQDFLNPDFMQ